MKTFITLSLVLLLMTNASHAKNRLSLGKTSDPISEISVRVLVEAYRRINIDLDFIELPAERSLVQSNSGQVDGEVNRVEGIDKKYANLIRIPVPINYFEGVVFTKERNFTVNGWESLKPYTIAIRRGAKFAENGTRGMDVHKFVTYEDVFKVVSRNRFDICVASRMVGLHQIHKQSFVELKVLEPPLQKFDLYHYLHKKHQNLVPKISSSLDEMTREGAIFSEREHFLMELLRLIEKNEPENSTHPK